MGSIKRKVREWLGMVSVQDLKSGVYSLNREITHIKEVLRKERKQTKEHKIEQHGVSKAG